MTVTDAEKRMAQLARMNSFPSGVTKALNFLQQRERRRQDVVDEWPVRPQLDRYGRAYVHDGRDESRGDRGYLPLAALRRRYGLQPQIGRVDLARCGGDAKNFHPTTFVRVTVTPLHSIMVVKQETTIDYIIDGCCTLNIDAAAKTDPKLRSRTTRGRIPVGPVFDDRKIFVLAIVGNLAPMSLARARDVRLVLSQSSDCPTTSIPHGTNDRVG